MTAQTTIIDQINIFLKNCFVFMVDLKNPESTKNKTPIKKIAGINCSRPILNYSRNFLPFEKIF